MAATTNAPYLRATVTGRQRYADLVLPTDEPVALLIPQLLSLLEEPADLGQVHLATSLGHVLDSSASLGETDLVDGVRLHLVTAHELPPAPLVHDLVDIVEESEAPGRWTERNRSIALAVLGGLLVGAAILLAFRVLSGFDGVLAASFAALLLALSGIAAVSSAAPLAAVSAALGVGTLGVLVQQADVGNDGRAFLLVALALVAIAAISWCSGQLTAGATSAAVLVLVAVVGGVTWLLTGDSVRTSAVVTVFTVFLVGLAPRLALGTSGVFGLDNRLAEGGEVATLNAEDAVARAHWTLTGAVVVAAAVFAAAAFVLGRDGEVEPWSAGLVVVVSLAFALRGRHFPLALHRAALWAAAVAGPVGLGVASVERWDDSAPLVVAALAGAGVALALMGVVRRSALQQARSRRRANQLETTTILLSLPVVLGVFHVYQDLLGTFQ
jgi:type VII secretion integral membrane protein EccD